MLKKNDLAKKGLINLGEVFDNLSPAQLIEQAVTRGEGELSATGALSVNTGKYSGRSPKDRFIVETKDTKENVNWGDINVPMQPDVYERLRQRQAAFLEGKDVFVFDGFIGKDPKYRLAVRVVNQYAWQNLFVHQMFVRPTEEEQKTFKPEYTIICTPGFQAIPKVDGTRSEAFVVLNYDAKEIIIGGTSYGGEMKKSAFTLMNYVLPTKGICAMHCSANIGKDGRTALFFGLSGTGKTTLSADPERMLIGDDEHGWTEDGIFNFEGGCYAKTINITHESEPQIWDAIKFGAIMENVVIDKDSREADFFDASNTENTRVAYPINHIPGAVMDGKGGHPEAIVFLTADAFGVLPPIAELDKNQASYYYLSGYTSKLAGTERGIIEPQSTFSAGFGAPFLPRVPGVYAELLRKKIEETGAKVYLLNTGWTGGPYGVGNRMKLSYTRAMVSAALNGDLADVKFEKDPIFGLSIPTSCPNVPDEVLNPRNTWSDQAEYDKTAKALAASFKENMKKLKGVEEEILAAGPIA